jgi:putative phosphoribosyl transferase
VCVGTPPGFFAIRQFYAQFPQVTDREVIACLERAATPQAPAQASTAPAQGTADPPARNEEVEPSAGPVRLAGYLAGPEDPREIVVFAHGSGSSRHSPRNRRVAGILNGAGLGTLLFDLLTAEEERDRANVFDIGLLAGRLAGVTGWLRAQPRAARAVIGYFGASTGAAAALWAAAEPGAGIAAVVSRGGRPDLARPRLAAVTAPTLLIVGGDDEVVLDLNRRARAELRCENDLALVPGATPPVRGAGHPRRGRRAGPGLVHQPLHAVDPAGTGLDEGCSPAAASSSRRSTPDPPQRFLPLPFSAQNAQVWAASVLTGTRPASTQAVI